MKVLSLVFFIICAHAFRVTDGFYVAYGSGLDKLVVPFMNAMEHKCSTDENPKQFQYALYELNHCVSHSLRESPERFNLSNYNQDHCSHINESQLRMCFTNFTTNISPCLAENETYIKQFIPNAFDVLYEELCGADRISNKQYIFDKFNRTGVCMHTCGLLLFFRGACKTAKLSIFKDLDKGILNFNKHDICSDLRSLYKCTTLLLEAVCNEEYSRLTGLIFHPFLKDCNDYMEGNDIL